MPVSSHSCKCPTKAHVMDWNTEGQSRNRAQATAQIAKQLLLACHSVLVIPGASDVMKGNSSLALQMCMEPVQQLNRKHPTLVIILPANLCRMSHKVMALSKLHVVHACNTISTEERIQQKAKAKLRKAQGIAPKKRLKFLENHFDDCGTDLSGLGIDPEKFEEKSAGHLAFQFMYHPASQHQLLETFFAQIDRNPVDILELCGLSQNPAAWRSDRV